MDRAFPACQKEQKETDFTPQRTFLGFRSQLGVPLPLFCRIRFPKIIPSPGKGAKRNNNSDKMKMLVVVCRKALKERVPFPIPKETCP